jgi:hypothetical protein
MKRYLRMNRLVSSECDEVFDWVIKESLEGQGEKPGKD